MGKEREREEQVATVRAVLGEATPQMNIIRALHMAGDDPTKAINILLDIDHKLPPPPSPSPSPSPPTARPTKAPTESTPPPAHLEASSVVTDRSKSNGSRGGGGRRRPSRDVSAAAHEDEPSKGVSTSGTDAGGGGQDSADPEAKRLKKMRSSDNNDNLRAEAQTDSGNASKAVDKKRTLPEQPKQDYIHVRARRGQATDSHSLAERARREKISERMKMLQDLVPGCNKVIGKASVLDEIINYIQSLQRQVEFLSMKLEAVNAHVNNRIASFPSKDVGAEPYHKAPVLTFDPQTPREYAQGPTSEWLHMQIGNAYERVT